MLPVFGINILGVEIAKQTQEIAKLTVNVNKQTEEIATLNESVHNMTEKIAKKLDKLESTVYLTYKNCIR